MFHPDAYISFADDGFCVIDNDFLASPPGTAQVQGPVRANVDSLETATPQARPLSSESSKALAEKDISTASDKAEAASQTGHSEDALCFVTRLYRLSCSWAVWSSG